MPLYDYACDACGHRDLDVSLTLAEHESGHRCMCGLYMHTIISPTAIVGPTDTRPMRIGGAGLEFTTKRELDSYLDKNPGHHPVSNTDSWMQRHRDGVRERVDTLAKNQGYRDWEHRQDSLRRENKKKRDLGES